MEQPTAEPPEHSESQPRWRSAVDRSRRTLGVWGILLAFVVYTLVQNIGSLVATPVGALQTQVECEGFTWIEPRECNPWGAEVLASGIPSGHSIEQVNRMIIKRSLFGLVDQCTAAFQFDDGTTAEREIECR